MRTALPWARYTMDAYACMHRLASNFKAHTHAHTKRTVNLDKLHLYHCLGGF